jgi:hypothetical protein
VATTTPALVPADTAPPEQEATKEPPQAEPPRDGPSAALHLHRRDLGGLRPDDLMVLGSGAPPARVPGPSVEMGPVRGVSDLDDAARVITMLRPGFRRCYNRALKSDPAMAGAFAVAAKIGPGGEVAGVDLKGPKGLAAELVACIAALFDRARFAPPEGGAATVTVPFTITRQ